MKFEHIGINVPDARAMAQWYVAHLGFSVVRSMDAAPHTHFLADETGRVVVEFYTNTAAPIAPYATQHPLVFHIAVWSSQASADRARLEKAGATLVSDDTLPDGSNLVMLRDPWGVALQLCQRAKPFPGF
jgi:catechol 2,3-dioxygenase-like lactoylglutathione lyase family enzyme